MRVTHIFRAEYPASLDARCSVTRSLSTIAAMQAIHTGKDIVVYSTTDSTIVRETAELAGALGISEAHIHISDDGSRVRVRNAEGEWGTLSLRTAGHRHSHVLMTTDDPIEVSAQGRVYDKLLYDKLIEDERAQPSDLVHLHDIWFSGYMKKAGIKNVFLHVHSAAESFTSMNTYLKQVAEDVQCEVADNTIVPSQPLVALSRQQAQILRKRGCEVLGYVHHGVMPPSEEELQKTSSGYLMNIGRIVPEKGAHRAVLIAQSSGKPLLIAGKVERQDQEYFDKHIRPYLTEAPFENKSPKEIAALIHDIAQNPLDAQGRPRIVYCGEVNDRQKAVLYAHADALVFPMTRQKAFGLVMIEAMSWGVPVIGFEKSGSIQEIVTEGRTGFIISGEEEEAIASAVKAVKRLSELSRDEIRQDFDGKWHSMHEMKVLETLYEAFFKWQHTQRSEVKGHADRQQRAGGRGRC